jgi:hypothetical protein
MVVPFFGKMITLGSQIRSNYLSRALLAEYPESLVLQRTHNLRGKLAFAKVGTAAELASLVSRRITIPVFLESVPTSRWAIRAMKISEASFRRAAALALDLHDDAILQAQLVAQSSLKAAEPYRQLRDRHLRSCNVVFFPSSSMLEHFAEELSLDRSHLKPLLNASDPHTSGPRRCQRRQQSAI